MSVAECDHGGDAATCPPCRDAGLPLPRPPREVRGPWRSTAGPYAARYDSVLACGHRVRVGDWIWSVDGEWVCDDCAGVP